MPYFSSRSKYQLSTCDHYLQTIFNEVIKIRDCTILEGYRNGEDQNLYYAQGKSQLRFPHSKHNSNPSRAVDVAPYFAEREPEKRISFVVKDVIAFAHFTMGIAYSMNLLHRIRWGGDWNKNWLSSDESFRDYLHWEMI